MAMFSRIILGKLPDVGIVCVGGSDAVGKSGQEGLVRPFGKQPGKVADDLVEEVKRQLVRRVVDLNFVATARREGRCGLTKKVKVGCKWKRSEVLIQASRWIRPRQIETKYAAFGHYIWLADGRTNWVWLSDAKL